MIGISILPGLGLYEPQMLWLCSLLFDHLHRLSPQPPNPSIIESSCGHISPPHRETAHRRER
jgi:hypothetical protein